MTSPGGPAQPADDVLLRALDIEFGYGVGGQADAPVLRGVRVELRRGDRVGLLGASGTGKSTLLHLLTGLLRPQRGTVERLVDRDVMPSLVFQFPERQLFAETVRQDVGYGLRESRVPRTEVAERVASALTDAGLPPEEFADRVPFHLSGGEMRRVGLAGALAQRRPILLLDEPTLGLDHEGRARLREILERVHARGVAMWMASHDVDFVAATCDRLVVLDAGRIAFDGPAAAFWADADRALRLGVERPRAVRLAGRLRDAGLTAVPEQASESELLAALAAREG